MLTWPGVRVTSGHKALIFPLCDTTWMSSTSPFLSLQPCSCLEHLPLCKYPQLRGGSEQYLPGLPALQAPCVSAPLFEHKPSESHLAPKCKGLASSTTYISSWAIWEPDLDITFSEVTWRRLRKKYFRAIDFYIYLSIPLILLCYF